jgi:Protein of unknown function (DUF3347)
MKTKSISLSIVFATSAIVLFSNCGNKKAETHDHAAMEEKDNTKTPPTSTAQFQVDAAFQQQLAEVFNTYAALKDAFVSSNPEKVKTEAINTQAALAKVDMKLLSGAPHMDWMNYLKGIDAALKEMQATNDLETQRKSFSALSDQLYKSIKAFGLGGATAFYEFCPMAFNNEGGYWLSKEEKIRNPYFGDQMLTCGSVKEKLN